MTRLTIFSGLLPVSGTECYLRGESVLERAKLSLLQLLPSQVLSTHSEREAQRAVRRVLMTDARVRQRTVRPASSAPPAN
jgi:hypothetical protein